MQVEVGAVVEGTVTGITKFGAFVSLPDGKSGLVHISEIANTYVSDVNEFLKLGDKVTFDLQNASGEGTNCTTIVSKFVSDKVDLIMANATDALAAASQATETIPVVATSITDYATALGITDWTGTTGFNVTGTSDLAPLEEQAQIIKRSRHSPLRSGCSVI